MKTINKTLTAVLVSGAFALLSHTSAQAQGMNPQLWAKIYNSMQTSQVEVAQATSEGDIQFASLPTNAVAGTTPDRVAEVARKMMAQIAF